MSIIRTDYEELLCLHIIQIQNKREYTTLSILFSIRFLQYIGGKKIIEQCLFLFQYESHSLHVISKETNGIN